LRAKARSKLVKTSVQGLYRLTGAVNFILKCTEPFLRLLALALTSDLVAHLRERSSESRHRGTGLLDFEVGVLPTDEIRERFLLSKIAS